MKQARRKGRPPIEEAKKRRRVNLTLSPEVLKLAEKAIEQRSESSLSELVEVALKKIMAEEPCSEADCFEALPLLRVGRARPTH